MQSVFSSYDKDKNGSLDDEELILFSRDCVSLIRKENDVKAQSEASFIRVESAQGEALIFSENGFFCYIIELMHANCPGPISWSAFREFCTTNPIFGDGSISASVISSAAVPPNQMVMSTYDLPSQNWRVRRDQLCFVFSDNAHLDQDKRDQLDPFIMDMPDSTPVLDAMRLVEQRCLRAFGDDRWDARLVLLSYKGKRINPEEHQTLRDAGVRSGSQFGIVRVDLVASPPVPKLALNMGSPLLHLPKLVLRFRNDDDMDKMTLGKVLRRAKKALQDEHGQYIKADAGKRYPKGLLEFGKTLGYFGYKCPTDMNALLKSFNVPLDGSPQSVLSVGEVDDESMDPDVLFVHKFVTYAPNFPPAWLRLDPESAADIQYMGPAVWKGKYTYRRIEMLLQRMVEMKVHLSIQRIYINQNGLEDLPPVLAEFTNCDLLNVRFNEFKVFPAVICKMKLKEFFADYAGSFSTIPAEFADMKSLTRIKLDNNYKLPEQVRIDTALSAVKAPELLERIRKLSEAQ